MIEHARPMNIPVDAVLSDEKPAGPTCDLWETKDTAYLIKNGRIINAVSRCPNCGSRWVVNHTPRPWCNTCNRYLDNAELRVVRDINAELRQLAERQLDD